ncbi:MAG: DnaJ C-terminal domain-containing protein [Planctomycetota bacterium]
MAEQDYYKTLGLQRGADARQIKSAYRRLARKYHPDVNKDPGGARRFQQATEAYDVLSDPHKRKLYDRYGQAGIRSDAGSWSAPAQAEAPKVSFKDIFGGAQSAFAGLGLDELLNKLRRKGGDSEQAKQKAHASRRKKDRGADAEMHVELSLEESIRGTVRPIRIHRQEPDGRSLEESLEVRIPPGVSEAGRVRVKGKGRPGKGEPGDLYIIVHVREHPYFQRQGRDLYVDLPLSLAEATLGASVDVPTLDGLVSMKVPPATASGRKLRLRGRGVPSTNGQPAGDLFVRIQILPPANLSPEARDLLRKFAEKAQAHGTVRRNAPWM